MPPAMPAFDFPVQFETATFTVLVEREGRSGMAYAFLVQGWREMLRQVAGASFVGVGDPLVMDGAVSELLVTLGDPEAWDWSSGDATPYRCVWERMTLPFKVTVLALYRNPLEHVIYRHGFPDRAVR